MTLFFEWFLTILYHKYIGTTANPVSYYIGTLKALSKYDQKHAKNSVLVVVILGHFWVKKHCFCGTT